MPLLILHANCDAFYMLLLHHNVLKLELHYMMIMRLYYMVKLHDETMVMLHHNKTKLTYNMMMALYNMTTKTCLSR